MFYDKESYLEWVQDWKEQYKEISARLRKAKSENRGWQSDWSLSGNIRDMKDTARMLLLIRRENKVKSYQMMKERLAKEAVV